MTKYPGIAITYEKDRHLRKNLVCHPWGKGGIAKLWKKLRIITSKIQQCLIN